MYALISAFQSNGLDVLQELFWKEVTHPLFWKSEQTQSWQHPGELQVAGPSSCDPSRDQPIGVEHDKSPSITSTDFS